ncbi:hypothetical protein [Nocardia sp. CNY236]|uniref:hypothetical protein n=1 Tax=Nocardia sp. CNY236 TaxID=1169152 RepID=UPI00040E9322|nr:hypothetical protein [Nocardia sp. CNY236]
MTSKQVAIGYIRRDVSGISQNWDEIQIRSLASRLRYDLAKTIVFEAGTNAPIAKLMNAVWAANAAAVIVPSVWHFGPTVPAELVTLADVITVRPRHTYTR